MLNITDRAVSKWENGKSLPDASIMLELCSILKISVNDLLNGSLVSMNDYNQKHEEALMDLVNEKQKADKRLLKLEVYIAIFSIIVLFGLIAIASFVEMKDYLKVIIIVSGFVLSISGFLMAIRIEQVVGYYECGKCGHKYVPRFINVGFALHLGRTRKMRCPKCHEKSWQKKSIEK
jgi:transcriptional regulator with XRE-family HTH domain/DNA-directed RNA polymerase subunit RPC12/RpoP